MKAKTDVQAKEKPERVSVTMMEFARVCEGAIAEACIKGLDNGMTPIQMCDFEIRLWAAANIIGNRLFRRETERVDFSDGRMEKVKDELASGIWAPKENHEEDADEDQGSL